MPIKTKVKKTSAELVFTSQIVDIFRNYLKIHSTVSSIHIVMKENCLKT